MTDIVTFTADRLGRIEARMGDRLVGMIETWPEPLRNKKPSLGEVRAVYQIFLPSLDGAIGTKRPASSITAARRHLLRWLMGWFVDAGPQFSAISEAIDAQALNEREGLAA